MTEPIGHTSVDTKAKPATMGLSEYFKTIGELARQAAQGDRSAELMLGILNNQQLAEIKNLELELAILNTRAVARATLQFMSLPEKPVK